MIKHQLAVFTTCVQRIHEPDLKSGLVTAGTFHRSLLKSQSRITLWRTDSRQWGPSLQWRLANLKVPELERASGDASGSCCALASRECDNREKHKWQLAITFMHSHIHEYKHTYAQVVRTQLLAEHHFLCKFNGSMLRKLNSVTQNLHCPTGLENTLSSKNIPRSWLCSTSELRPLHYVTDLLCKMQHATCAPDVWVLHSLIHWTPLNPKLLPLQRRNSRIADVPGVCEVEGNPYPRLRLFTCKNPQTPVQVSAEQAEPAYSILPHPVSPHTHAPTHTRRCSHDGNEEGKQQKGCFWKRQWSLRPAGLVEGGEIMCVRKICPLWKERGGKE